MVQAPVAVFVVICSSSESGTAQIWEDSSHSEVLFTRGGCWEYSLSSVATAPSISDIHTLWKHTHICIVMVDIVGFYQGRKCGFRSGGVNLFFIR